MSKKLQALKATTLSLTFVAITALYGCATPVSPVTEAPDAEVMAMLATYADRASIANQRLASIRSGTAGIKIENVEVPEGLEVPISITWSGPVDQMVKKVAELTGYEYGGSLGNSKTPVLVSVTVANMPAFNVLADAGAQAGAAVDIVVHPNTKKIFVKYPPASRTGGYPQQSR